MIVKILKIHKNDSLMRDFIEIEFYFNEERFLINADFDIRNDSSDFNLENELIINDKGQEFKLNDFNKNVRLLINHFIISYLEKENNFFNYHYTGTLSDDSYTKKIIKDINNYPILIGKFFFDSEEFEFRQTGEKLKYVKKNINDEIIRDSNGYAVYLSDEEMNKKCLPIYETSIVVFNEKKESVGLASDEWGADGIWINTEYQRKGIGTKLVELFRSQFSEDRKMGQMTYAGKKLARSFYRKNNLNK